MASAAVTLEVPAGAPAVPAGFSSSGLTAVGVAGAAAVATGAAVAGAAAGGGISTGVIVAVAGVAAAGAGVAVAVGAAKGGGDSAPARTTYTGTFSQPWQRSQTTSSSTGSTTCLFDNVLSGSVTITIEPPGSSPAGRAAITIGEAETGRSANPLCNGGPQGPPAGGTYPVLVNGSGVTFKVPNNNGSGLAVPYDFDGVLSGGVITGKMAFAAVGTTPGSGGFGTIVSQAGSTEIPLSLR